MIGIRVHSLSLIFDVLLQFLFWTGSLTQKAEPPTDNVTLPTTEYLSTEPLTTTFPPVDAPSTSTPAASSGTPTSTESVKQPAKKLVKLPQAVCPRATFHSAVIEQLQRLDTSKCMLKNTIMQETLELPQINYASKDCLAKVLAANDEVVNKGAVLDDKDNDHYLRNPCEKAREKFLVIRLCDRIKPTLLEIANLEFFSSAPKEIRFSVSKNYPTSDWTLVGQFEMQNRRDVQRFPISMEFENFVKFVKLEFLSHYGKEYYCTLSFLRVYGTPGPNVNSEESNNTPSSNAPSDEKIAIQRPRNISNDLSTNANAAALFMEFGKRLTTLEANFKHYGQVVQSIRLLRNETRYLNQETSALRRHIFGLQRDRDTLKRMVNRVKIENRRLRQELKEVREDFKLSQNASTSNLLATKDDSEKNELR